MECTIMKSKSIIKKTVAFAVVACTLTTCTPTNLTFKVEACGSRHYEHNYQELYYSPCASYHTSIVDALKSIGVNSSYSNRRRIAQRNGIYCYTGKYSENVKLLRLLKNGQLWTGRVSCR